MLMSVAERKPDVLNIASWGTREHRPPLKPGCWVWMWFFYLQYFKNPPSPANFIQFPETESELRPEPLGPLLSIGCGLACELALKRKVTLPIFYTQTLSGPFLYTEHGGPCFGRTV